MIGLGVLIQTFGGNAQTVETVKSALGKTINTVWIDDNTLYFKFTDGTNIKLSDEGQSCCEYRYMDTSDDLSEYEGSVLIDFELKPVKLESEDNYGDHEIQFLDVKTDKGIFTVSNHNEHNGYYGGFWIVAKQF